MPKVPKVVVSLCSIFYKKDSIPWPQSLSIPERPACGPVPLMRPLLGFGLSAGGIIRRCSSLKNRAAVRTGNHLCVAGQVAGFNLGFKFRQRIKSLADLFIG